MSTTGTSATGNTADGATRLRAVVTGASSGIGAATVRRLRAEGWDVVAVARRADRLEALAAETGAEPFPCDITSDDDVARLTAHVEATGGLTSLVNNAGGALGLDRVEHADVEGWRRMYETNVLGTLRITKALLPALRASGRGDVLVVTSTAAIGAYEGGAGYTAAKHAVAVMTETLRLELVGRPVRVCEVAPGMVRTEEFSLTRLHGDQAAADKVYEGVDRPLAADDVAECVGFAVGLPQHVNLDTMVIKPVAQAAPHKVHRGAIDWKDA